MYRNFTHSAQRTTANLLGLKYLLRDFSEMGSKQFTKLNQEEIDQILTIHNLSNVWKSVTNTQGLSRKYQFSNFQDSFSFMAQVSQIAEQMKHYPKWFNKNGLVTIDLSTKEVDGVTVKDVILAYTAEHIAQIINQNKSNSLFDNQDIHINDLIQSWNNNYQKNQEFNHVLDRAVNYV